MTAFVLITGALWRKPELRRARNGKAFVTAKIRMSDNDGNYSYWAINAFDEGAAQSLLSCDEGDLIAARGALRQEVYTPEGKPPRINATCTATGILNLSQRPKHGACSSRRLCRSQTIGRRHKWPSLTTKKPSSWNWPLVRLKL
jgi:single-stranded DNA-binding protein